MNTVTSETREPVVWVIEQMPHDYSPAKVFASEIRQIVADKLTPNAPDESWNSRTIMQMSRALSDYMPGVDFIIPTGSPVRMLTAGLLLSRRGDVHNFLGWDNRTGRYLLYRINLRSLPYGHSEK